MRKHNKTSGDTQLKGRKIQLKAEWFIRGHSVIVGVWVEEKELAAFVAPIDLWTNKKSLGKIVETLLGGRVVWIK